MKVAALDLGSNTFLCLVCEVDHQKITKIYDDQVQIVRLGQGFGKSPAKIFHHEALSRADECLKSFQKIIDNHQPEKILAMATSATRDANNKEELFSIGKKYNIPIEVIPGDKEAEITYRGSISGLNAPGRILVVDIGGGSTEFIFGDNQKILMAKSYDIGCVRLTEKYIYEQPTPDIQIKSASLEIQKAILDLKNEMQDFLPDQILTVAGTPTAIAAAEIGRFDPDLIDGYRLTRAKLIEWKSKLSSSSVEQKIEMGIPEGRADVIIIGVLTLLEILKTFNKEELIVSTRGVRYGVALELAARFHS